MKNIFVLLSLTVLIISCGNSKAVVATYKSGNVTVGEIEDIFKNIPMEEKVKMQSVEDFYKLARKVAIEKIILNESEKNGLRDDKTVLKEIEVLKKELLFDKLREKNVLSKVKVTEDDYHKYKKIYELYQIVVRTDTLSEERLKKAKSTLETLRKSIKTIDDFKNAAKKYSEDVSASNGGYLGKLRLGIMDDAIDSAIQKLKVKEVSPIVETYSGYHLLYVNGVEEIDPKELYSDKKLYDTINGDKTEAQENRWFKSMLGEPGLKIDYDAVKNGTPDKTVIKLKDKIVTRKDIEDRIKDLRQNNAFPEPTEGERRELIEKTAIKLVLDTKLNDTSVLSDPEVKRQLDLSINYYLMNVYISRNLKKAEITDAEIKKFYDDNIVTLFTFKDERNKDIIQPMGEVKGFIVQKLEASKEKESRYDLYRKLTSDEKLVINNDVVEYVKNKLAVKK